MCLCYTEKNIESLSLSLSYLIFCVKNMITQIKQIIDDSTMVQNVQFTMQSSIIQLINNLAIFTSKHA